MVVLLGLAGGLSLPAQAGPPGQGPSGGSNAALIEHLKQETGGAIRISYHAETGKVRFIGTSPDRPIAQPAILSAGASPETGARGFLATYGQLFGLQNQARELAAIRVRSVDRGRSFVRFRQMHRGVPVLGGELIVQLDADQRIVAATGEILPDLELETTPTIDAQTARLIALTKVAKDYGVRVEELRATDPELWIYNPILLGGPGLRRSRLVWRMDVTPVELLPIRELVLVDARHGIVVLHFNQIDTARNRLTYDALGGSSLPGVLRRSEGQGPYGDPDVDAAHDYAGDTYDFYFNMHGRDSIDNAGMDIISSVHYGGSICPNAFWDESQMVYCDGFPQADDVVGHELTHGVTQYESNLFYYMQSGAINESFSDVWGEFVDLTNGAGNDGADVRWEMGEDEPNYGTLRDMQDPTTFGDPDRMTGSNYYCGENDNGGVHINSGVNNKAASLMVDGGSFNGYTVTGIGLDKVARIYYEVQTNLFTSAGDYQDLYDNLYQACLNLVGTDGITTGDCQQVRNATLATEMNQQPTSCSAPHAPLCDSGTPSDLFFDDMENTASGNWTWGAITGSSEWSYDNEYATSGVWHLYGYDQPDRADYYVRMTFDVSLPSDSTPYLHFNHAYAFEDSFTTMYDGGVLEYSTNGGSSWNDAGSLFTHNGYDGTISNFYGNPLGGRQAFGHESNGYLSSRLDLSALAGQNVRFRFRIGTDNLGDAYGWFIDDVRIYTCVTANTAPTIASLPDQQMAVNTSRDNAIDLWAYTSDPESSDGQLTFTIDNTPEADAGVSLDSNRYIDINPTLGWTGQTSVTIRVTDPGSLSDTDTFSVTVVNTNPSTSTFHIYLPLVFKAELSFEEQLIALINTERSSRGLVTLSPDSILMQVAENHSQDMVDRNFFSHINPDGLGPAERVTNAGYSWSALGETIGAGYSTPQAMFDGWMNSSGHRDILLSPDYTEIGVGYVAGGTYGHYWTAVFARPQ